MPLLRLLSSFPPLRQQAIVSVTPTTLKAKNVRSLKESSIDRTGSHPRTLVGDWFVLVEDMETVLRNIFDRRWVRSDLLICLNGIDEGGYTEIERRAFREAAQAAGAKSIYLSEQGIPVRTAIQLFDGSVEKVPSMGRHL